MTVFCLQASMKMGMCSWFWSLCAGLRSGQLYYTSKSMLRDNSFCLLCIQLGQLDIVKISACRKEQMHQRRNAHAKECDWWEESSEHWNDST